MQMSCHILKVQIQHIHVFFHQAAQVMWLEIEDAYDQ